MKSSRLKRRRFATGLFIVFGLAAFGVSAPILFNFFGEEIQLDDMGVVAAPRDQFLITHPIHLDRQTGSFISGGRLALAVAKGQDTTAEKSAKLIQSGNATLLLSHSELSLGATEAAPTIEGPEPRAPLVHALQEGLFKALGIRQSTILLPLPDGRTERLVGVDGKLVSASNGSIDAKGEGLWRGQRAKFELTAAPVDKSGHLPFKLKFDATLLHFVFEGTIDMANGRTAAGPASVHIKDTKRLARSLGTSWPIGTSLQDVKIAGPLRWQGSTLVFDKARVTVGDNKAQGTVSVETVKERAMISSTLAFEKLDIAAYLPIGDDNRPKTAWHWWSNVVATLAQPAAPHIDADIRLSTKTLMSGSHKLGPAAAAISLSDGVLSADIAEITLDSGRATGQISVDFNRYIPKLALRGRLEDIEMDKWLDTLIGHPTVSGKGRIVVDLSSQGTSMLEIASDLRGEIGADLAAGGAVALSVADLDATNPKNRARAPSEIVALSSKGSTVVKELNLSCDVRDGVMQIRKGNAKHAAGSLQMAGQYDLVRRDVDVRLLSLLNAPSFKAAGAESVASAGSSSALADTPTPNATLVVAKTDRHTGQLDVELHPVAGGLHELQRRLGTAHLDRPRRGF